MNLWLRQLKRMLIFSLALLFSILIALFLIPVLLAFMLIAGLIISYVLVRRNRPLPKGTIEILPPEEVKKRKTTPSDVEEVEIEVENLKRNSKSK